MWRRLAHSVLPTFRRNLLLSPLTEGRLKVLAKHGWSCRALRRYFAEDVFIAMSWEADIPHILFFTSWNWELARVHFRMTFVFDSCTPNDTGSGFCPNSFGFTPLTIIPPLFCTNTTVIKKYGECCRRMRSSGKAGIFNTGCGASNLSNSVWQVSTCSVQSVGCELRLREGVF